MTSKAALLALLTIWGVGLGSTTLPARADDVANEDPSTGANREANLPSAELTNRLWVRTAGNGLQDLVRIFLSDGTLVEDNFWETHRLSSWKMLPDDKLSWNEGGKEVTARIASLTPDRLTLIRYFEDGPVEERYRSAQLPDGAKEAKG
ncbi:MAG TPA: hypothetical protein VL418_16815 [Devosiaceae bacterium]|nr:hypothetical protein [Devosiaceae bacterium]